MAKAKPKPRKRKPVAPRARVTKPEKETGRTGAGAEEARLEFAYWQLGLHDEWKEQLYVNSYTAETYSVVWRCINYISQTIAGLGWHQFESTPGKPGKERIYDDVSWLLDMQVSPEMNAFEWRQAMLRSALMRGNGYSEIDRDGFGRVRWLWFISEERVKLERDDAGQLYYEIDNGVGNKPSLIRPENMFHLRGPGPDGLTGYSVLALARQSIRLGMQVEKYGDTFFKRGPMPGGILEMPGNPPEEQRKSTRKSFEDAYGGAKNAGRVVVVTGGMKFNPLSLPNEDAQFIESRKFQVNEICRWFGVPPHKVFDLERATFSNIEHQSIEAVQDCHLPWCRRLEAEADLKLFGRVMRGRRWTRLNLNTLLRGDSATQTENLVKQVTAGLTKIDEAREHLDMNPLQDGLGEVPLAQGAMAPLDRIIHPPEPVQPAPMPAQDNDEPKQEPDDQPQDRAMPAQVAATFGMLLTSEYDRWLRVESDKAKRADNKGEISKHIAGHYTPEAQQRVADTLRPVVAALLLACGRSADRAAEFANSFAASHVGRSIEELHDGTWAASWTNGRADSQAREHLRSLWESLK